mmetsp:Transcript_54649/g.132721  ORF Transcript_54649/g.132721 Transcript_54649/m.132721 type:complete len:343 (+) Transcript_54649:77-1105(+)
MVSIGAIHENGDDGSGRVVAAVAPAAATTESIARTGGPGSIVFDNLPAGLVALGSGRPRNDDDNDDDAAAHTDDEVGSGQNDSVGNFSAGQLSVDTTRIASSVGSIVRASREAFLRSVTFMKDQPDDLVWDLVFQDPTNQYKRSLSGTILQSFSRRGSDDENIVSNNGGTDLSIRRKKKKSDQLVKIASIGGHLSLSKLQVGEVVTKINSKKIGPSYNAQRCNDLLNKFLDTEDGIVSVQTGNDGGIDTIVQVTVIKPDPKMTCKDLGLTVWFWRGLCIKGIDPGSMFSHTALKMDDELERVNDIDVQNLQPEAFHRIIDELPYEVTIEVKRGKQRWSGMFG